MRREQKIAHVLCEFNIVTSTPHLAILVDFVSAKMFENTSLTFAPTVTVT